MKTPEKLNIETKDLILKLKSGEICQNEAVIRFEIILKELEQIIGRENEVLKTLKINFQKKITILKKFEKMVTEKEKVNEGISFIKYKYNLA